MLEQVTQVLGRKSLVSARIEQTKSLILEMGHEVGRLSYFLKAEEARVGISDPNHYAYSPLARALRERRDRVDHSIDTLTKKLAENVAEMATSADEQNPVTARSKKRNYWRYDRSDRTLFRSPQSPG